VTFGATSYQQQTMPANAVNLPDQLVWTGAQFVGLERNTDFHNTAATMFAWTSADGKAWTRSTTDLKNAFVGLGTANGKLFQVQAGWQSNFSGYKIFTSNDGLAWTGATVENTGFSTSAFLGAKYLNGRYFVSTDTDCMLMTSTDAATWTAVDLKTVNTSAFSVPPGYTNYCSQPVYRNGTYYVYSSGIVGVGGTFRAPERYAGIVYTSTDGVSWTLSSFALPAGYTSIPATGGRVFDVTEVGNTLLIPSITGSGVNQLATSTDGVNWTLADASGLTYGASTVGKPALTDFLGFSLPEGTLAKISSNCTTTAPISCGAVVNTTYFYTTDGKAYSSAPDFGLIPSSMTATRRYAYSPTLGRLVVMEASSNKASAGKLGTLDLAIK
jgi:hypothetical protein